MTSSRMPSWADTLGVFKVKVVLCRAGTWADLRITGEDSGGDGRGADGQAEPGQRAASTDPGVSMVRCRVHRAEGQLRRGRVCAPGEGRGPARPPRPRPLTDEQRAALLEVDGEARDAMVRELQADGVSSRSLGAVLGMPDWQMSDHYPRGGSPD